MKHLKLFKTQAEFDVATLDLPNVSLIQETNSVAYFPAPIDYSKEYFTIESLEDNNNIQITPTLLGDITAAYINQLSYAINNDNFIDLYFEDYNEDGAIDSADVVNYVNNYYIKLNKNDKLKIKINNAKFYKYVDRKKKNILGANIGTSIFTSDKTVNISGNILSLLYGDNFNDADMTSLSEYTHIFSTFFQETNIVSAHNLILPDFITPHCYSGMFYGCTSLITCPKLPFTTLKNNCYEMMFEGCISLTTAPELPATTLTDGCYSYMFYGCSNLNNVKMLATDISATDCLTDWINGVSSTGTFVKHPDMKTLPTSTNGIPSGWTVVDYQE